MTPIFTPEYYSDADILAQEQEKIFRRQWQFAAFSHQLENDNDYVSAEIGGRSFFVQRFDGKLSAFSNVCSHRFSQIHTEGCGNRRAECRYHGWIYDGEGLPTAIPHRPRFDDMTPEKVCGLRLTRWQVEECGGLVFVRESAEGPSLREFLGEAVFHDMERMTLALGPRIDCNEMIIDANWKIVVENTLEGYHVGFVHTDTFHRLGTLPGGWQWNLPHSRYSSPLSEKVDADCQKVMSLFDSRPVKVDGYLHQLIFPNLTVATTYGTSFSVQTFEPLGPDQTKFTSHVFQTKLEEEPTGVKAAVLESVNISVKDFNRKVFEEDRLVVELVHRGAKETRVSGLLSDEEYRVGEFQKSYIEALEGTGHSAGEVSYEEDSDCRSRRLRA